jgi:hypothetical protein
MARPAVLAASPFSLQRLLVQQCWRPPPQRRADEVIDYQTVRFESRATGMDLVLDLGSGLIDDSQKRTAAARQIAEK